MTELTKRRYAGNADAWKLDAPSPKVSIRTTSTRSTTLRGLDLNSYSSNKSLRSQALNQDALGIIEDKGSKSNGKTNEMDGSDDKDTDKIEITTKEKLDKLYVKTKQQLKALVTDQWRRATQSGNDPYVKISLKPTPENGG